MGEVLPSLLGEWGPSAASLVVTYMFLRFLRDEREARKQLEQSRHAAMQQIADVLNRNTEQLGKNEAILERVLARLNGE